MAKSADAQPKHHRTIDRVARILEEVVYNPGMSFVELVRALKAPKSSVHGFLQGLLAKGWIYEEQRRFYLGPAVYGLTIASGHIRAGLVTQADLAALQDKTGPDVAVFVGVRAGDDLIYIAEAGGDNIMGYEARSNIRRTMLATAGGKALLAALPDAERDAFLRRHGSSQPALVRAFLEEYEEIVSSGIASNLTRNGKRLAIATTLHNPTGKALAAITMVGSAATLKPRAKKFSQLLLKHVEAWAHRSLKPREPI